MLQCAAVCCSVMQHVAVWCSVVQRCCAHDRPTAKMETRVEEGGGGVGRKGGVGGGERKSKSEGEELIGMRYRSTPQLAQTHANTHTTHPHLPHAIHTRQTHTIHTHDTHTHYTHTIHTHNTLSLAFPLILSHSLTLSLTLSPPPSLSRTHTHPPVRGELVPHPPAPAKSSTCPL